MVDARNTEHVPDPVEAAVPLVRRSTKPPRKTGTLDPVEATRALVRTPSVNPRIEDGGAGEEAVAKLAAGWLVDWGYDATAQEVAPGRFNVVARRGRGATGNGGAPSLLLNGHLDTVGVAEMDAPFSGDVREGRVWGRGAADMKSGVACILSVAAELAKEEFPGELIVALTADEEHASLGMQAVVESGLRADAAVVCEPTSLAVMPAHKGFLWIEAVTKGRAAHGSRPDEGVDAIVRTGHLLVALEEEARRLRLETNHPLLGPASLHAGTIKGGSAPSVYPGRCELVVERRTLPGESRETVAAEFEAVLSSARKRCPGLDVRMETGLYRAGTEAPADSPVVEELRKACVRHGLPGEARGMSAWVDACFLNQAGIPAVCFGPGSIAQAHTNDEWVAVSEIRTCAAVLADFARRFLAGARTPAGG